MQSKVSSNNASRTKNNNSEPFHSDPSALRPHGMRDDFIRDTEQVD